MTAAKDVLFQKLERKYEHIGPLRMARYDDILGDEEHEVDAQSRQFVHFRLQMLDLTRKIAEATDPERYPTVAEKKPADDPDAPPSESVEEVERKMTRDEYEGWVYSALTNDQWSRYGEVFRPHLDDISMLFAVMPNSVENMDRMVHVAILSRGEVEVDGEWIPVQDWTIENTRKLPRRLRHQINAFMENEQKGWPKPEPADAGGKAGTGKGKAAS